MVGDSVNLADSGGRERRVSQDFTELRQRFVDQPEGGGVQMGEEQRGGIAVTNVEGGMGVRGYGDMGVRGYVRGYEGYGGCNGWDG